MVQKTPQKVIDFFSGRIFIRNLARFLVKQKSHEAEKGRQLLTLKETVQ